MVENQVSMAYLAGPFSDERASALLRTHRERFGGAYLPLPVEVTAGRPAVSEEAMLWHAHSFGLVDEQTA